MIPLNPAQYPQGKLPIVDAGGALTQPGGLSFLLPIFNRTGGSSGIPIKVSNNLAATGTAQDSALALTQDWNEVLTTPAGSGVQLSPLQPGQPQRVYNGGASALNVYPQSNVEIDALGLNEPYVLAPGKTQEFDGYSAAQVRSVQWG